MRTTSNWQLKRRVPVTCDLFKILKSTLVRMNADGFYAGKKISKNFGPKVAIAHDDTDDSSLNAGMHTDNFRTLNVGLELQQSIMVEW